MKHNELKGSLFVNNRTCFYILSALICISTILDTASSLIIQNVIDFATGSSKLTLKSLLFACVCYLLTQLILLFVIRHMKLKFNYTAMTNYKSRLMNRILGKAANSAETATSSVLLSSLTHDADIISSSYVQSKADVAIQLCLLFTSLIMMIYYSPILTITAVVLSLLSLVIFAIYNKPIVDAEKNVSNENSGFISSLQNIISGFSIIKTFAIENTAQAQFDAGNTRYELSKAASFGKKETANILSSFVGSISQIGVILLGALFIANGQITVGTLVAFTQLNSLWIMPLRVLPQMIADMNAGKALIDKHEEMLDNMNSECKYISNATLTDGLTLRNIRVSVNEQILIDDIDFSFKAHKKYAIVGKNGSGKTTLLKVISGLFDNFSGDRIWDDAISKSDGIPICTLMNQDVFLFDDTIGNNITLYRDVSADNLSYVIDRCRLRSLIEQRGLDYYCGEDGQNLSGGEKQKIALARCLIDEQSVLLLDEATSAMDEQSEIEVIQTIAGLDDATCVAAIHNLSPDILSRFDEIIVLRDGSIAETGNYDKLQAKRGYFYSLTHNKV